jgi:hypothetical protein
MYDGVVGVVGKAFQILLCGVEGIPIPTGRVARVGTGICTSEDFLAICAVGDGEGVLNCGGGTGIVAGGDDGIGALNKPVGYGLTIEAFGLSFVCWGVNC